MHKSPDVDAELFCSLKTQRRIINREAIRDVVKKVRPVVRIDGKLQYVYLEYQDVHHVSFLTNPRLRDAEVVLQEYSVIHTIHRFGFASQFRPTIAEIVTMFPTDLSPEIIAFETIGPQNAQDLRRQDSAIEQGFHVASTILYTL